MIGINIILKLYRKFLLAFAYRNFLLNTITSINFIKKIKSMGFSMTVWHTTEWANINNNRINKQGAM